MQPILSVRNLSTGYGKKQVLFDVSLDVMPGEIVLITGGNGSGKSTLLKAIYGLLPQWNADSAILFSPNSHGPSLTTRQPSQNLRNGLAYLPQKKAVFEDFTVEDNLRLAGHTLRNRNQFSNRRKETLALLPVLKPLLGRKPENMSGGERQIVALAMTLLHRPSLLLLDEPTAGMDHHNIQFIEDAIRTMHQHDTTIFLVEHRITEFFSAASRSLHLRLGSFAVAEANHDQLADP